MGLGFLNSSSIDFKSGLPLKVQHFSSAIFLLGEMYLLVIICLHRCLLLLHPASSVKMVLLSRVRNYRACFSMLFVFASYHFFATDQLAKTILCDCYFLKIKVAHHMLLNDALGSSRVNTKFLASLLSKTGS